MRRVEPLDAPRARRRRSRRGSPRVRARPRARRGTTPRRRRRGSAAHRPSATSAIGVAGGLVRTAGERQAARTERRSFAFGGLDRHFATVRLRDVAHDREPEPRAAGRRGSAPCRPGRSARRSARGRATGSRCRGRDLTHDARPSTAVAVDLDRLARLGVLDRVVEQVGDRAHHLTTVARAPTRSSGIRATRERDARDARRRPHPLDRLVDQHAATGTGSRLGRSWASMRLRSRRSSTMRPSRSASRTSCSASRRLTSTSSHRRNVSASSPSAPIGVLSSWLTLATKSRRTLSTRRSSVTSWTNAAAPSSVAGRATGPRARSQHLARRAEQRELRSPTLARAAPASSSVVDELLRDGVAVAGVAEALGRSAADHLVARRRRRR